MVDTGEARGAFATAVLIVGCVYLLVMLVEGEEVKRET